MGEVYLFFWRHERTKHAKKDGSFRVYFPLLFPPHVVAVHTLFTKVFFQDIEARKKLPQQVPLFSTCIEILLAYVAPQVLPE